MLLKLKLVFFTESEQEVTHWLSALGTGRSCSLALRLEKDFDLFASGLSADMVGGRLEVDFLVFGGQIRLDDGAPEGVTAADAVDELGGKPELGTLRHDVRHTVH